MLYIPRIYLRDIQHDHSENPIISGWFRSHIYIPDDLVTIVHLVKVYDHTKETVVADDTHLNDALTESTLLHISTLPECLNAQYHARLYISGIINKMDSNTFQKIEFSPLK